jgi:type I restriction enzyme M protein
MVFKKCRENPDDVLFIDASNDYDKVKTQNVLREEHIHKIIDTYRNRTEIEKYSRKAPIHGGSDSIAAQDYNLNIPRYVDTFEAEGEIDIEAIAMEIKAIDESLNATDQTIADFCKELNISTPF